MQFVNVDQETLFKEVIERGRAQGITDRATYANMVEEVIEAHVDLGEIDEDAETEALEDWISARWPQYRDALGLDEDNATLG